MATAVDPLEHALLTMNRVRARELFAEGVRTQGPLPYLEGRVAAVLNSIGQAWEAGTVALSQVYMAGRICEELSAAALPADDPTRVAVPRLALTIFEDQHTLGKRMVMAVLRNQGFAVADWGQLSLDAAVQRIKDEPVDLLLISCLMLSSALRIAKLTESIRREGLPVRVVVGGAPFRFDPALWQEVGADAMGATASDAARIVREFANLQGAQR